jgi:hypothetical protein
MKLKALLLAALLAGCTTTASHIAPVYGCEGIAEFGCPDIAPAPDAE